MRLFLCISFILLTTSLIQAQPPVGPADPGDQYGAATTAAGTLSTPQLLKELKQKDSITAKIEGRVLSSCPKKGCWMEMELADKSKMFVRFKDYGFFVPKAIAGKTVVVDGIAFTKTTSVQELKHYAQDAKKSQAEIDAITQPRKETRFLADGVLVIK
ncbi:hypothetical protein GCM10027051_01800 [Niabella terrae]